MRKTFLALATLGLISACGGGDSPASPPTPSPLPGISNIIIGGGSKNCSSFNGDTQSANCSADWGTILAQDAAFAGLGKSAISFEATYAVPTLTYSLSQRSLDAFNAVPASLFNPARKHSVLASLTARLGSGGPESKLTFAELDGSQPLFADGLAFWNNSAAADYDTLLKSVCGAASPANGADCLLSDANLASVQSAIFSRPSDKDKVLVILRNLQAKYGKTESIKFRNNADGTAAAPNFRSEFRARQLAADGSAVAAGLTAALTAAEKAVLRSALVEPNRQTSRKIEARSVKFLADPASLEIYSQFVSAARVANGGQTPTIGVVTASADTHPFADRDINVTALQSAGAKVVYLPMDGGFRQALDAGDCANTRYFYDSYANSNSSGEYFHSDQIYPDLAALQQDLCANGGALLASTLQSLNGIFFSGGDQARHLESFVTRDAAGSYSGVSAQLAALQARHAAGQLVVAGTSAGNHAQGGGVWKGKPVPMLGGGDSYAALRSGFKPGSGPVPGANLSAIGYARGGLGFFNFGVLDSHFSRRTREGRLMRFTHESGMDYGFGVDENTALVVRRKDAAGISGFSVVGDGGVFIVDVRAATATGSTTGNYSIDGVKAHYLMQGDSAEIDAAGNLTVTLASSRPVLPLIAGQNVVTQDKVQDYGSSNFLNLAKAMGLKGAAAGYGTTAGSADGRGETQNAPLYSATLTRTPATVFRGVAAGQLSYTHVTLKFAPCAAECTAPVLP